MKLLTHTHRSFTHAKVLFLSCFIIVVFGSSLVTTSPSMTAPQEATSQKVGMTPEEAQTYVQENQVSEEDLAKAKKILEDHNDVDRLTSEAMASLSKAMEKRKDNLQPTTFESTSLPDLMNLALDHPYEEWVNQLLEDQYMPFGAITDPETTEVLHRTNNSITTKTTIEENITLVETKTVLGKPEITVIKPDLSILDNISVPLIRSGEGMDAQESSKAMEPSQYERTVTFDTYFGFNLTAPLLSIDESLNLEFIRFGIQFEFGVGVWFMLPIQVELTYPTQVFTDLDYELSMKITPKTYDDEYEIGVKVFFDVGFQTDIRLINIRWESSCYDVWLGEVCIYYPVPEFYWSRIVDVSLPEPYTFSFGFDILTPMGTSPRDLIMTHIPTGSYFGVVEVGIGGSQGMISCERVEGDLGVQVSAGGASTPVYAKAETLEWGANHDPYWKRVIKTEIPNRIVNAVESGGLSGYQFPDYVPELVNLTFQIPDASVDWDTGDTLNVQYSVSDLRYFVGTLYLSPMAYMRFHGPLSDLPEIPLPLLGLPGPFTGFYFLLQRLLTLATTNGPLSNYMVVPSSFEYQTTEAVEIISSSDFNHTASLSPDPNFVSEDGRTEQYLLNITNTGESNDQYKIYVNGLPLGSTYRFDTSFFFLRVNESKIFTLTVHNNYPIREPAGPKQFNVTVSSAVREIYHQNDPNISLSIVSLFPTMTILPYFDLGLTNRGPGNTTTVLHPEDLAEIPFTIENLGNKQEEVRVEGTLIGPGGYTYELTREYNMSRYGLYGNSESGSFTFRFSPDDQFLAPGIYEFKVFAYLTGNTTVNQTFSRSFEFKPYYRVSTTITPSEISMRANFKQTFQMTITNIGNTIDNFTISADGWSDYLSFPTRVVDLPPGFSETIQINLTISDPSSIPVGLKIFSMTAQSEGQGSVNPVFASKVVNVVVLEPDLTPPGFDRFYNGRLLVYPQSPLPLGPSWTPRDDEPNGYQIFVNGTIAESDNWVNGNPVVFEMTGPTNYSVGLYNVTCVFYDLVGNTVSDTVWVQIGPPDPSPPVITGSSGFVRPVNFLKPFGVKWVAEEDHVMDFVLYINGTVVPTTDIEFRRAYGTNLWNVTYWFPSNSYTEGLWNLTLVVSDMSGFSSQHSNYVNLTAPDLTIPVMGTLPSSTINQSNDDLLIFSASDDYPDYFETWANQELIYSGQWQNQSEVALDADELPLLLGLNDLQLRVYDLSGNSYFHNWSLVVYDVDVPVFLSIPENLTISEHELITAKPLTWVLGDDNPDNYTVYLNGTPIRKGIWLRYNNTINLIFSPLRKGVHEIVFEAEDLSGNKASVTTILTIIDTAAPDIRPMNPIVYAPCFSADWFDFSFAEVYPRNYSLFVNDSLVDQGEAYDYHQIIQASLAGLYPGMYNFTLAVTDESNNTGMGSVLVTVADYTPPSILGSPYLIVGEGVNQSLSWVVNENNPKSYKVYQNGSLIESGQLDQTNGSYSLEVQLGTLSLGHYEYVITVEDQSGFITSLVTFVKVVDITSPLISDIGPMTVEFGPDTILEWFVTESNPDSYTISVNGTTVKNESWSGVKITLPVAGWSPGTYLVLLEVVDTSGNVATNEVIVVLVDSWTKTTQNTGTTAEETSSPGFTLEILLILGFVVIFLKPRRRGDS